ncbi:MAG: hypothetical protein AB7S26_28450 [Sandaracinaceae bacterium]
MTHLHPPPRSYPRALALASFLLGAALLTGCLGERYVGHFDDNAFYASRGHYRIRYENPGALLGPDWELTNFERDELGQPIRAIHVPNADDAHAISEFAPVRREYAFGSERVDLRYVNSDGVSEIFTRTLPMSPAWARAELSAAIARAVIALGTPIAGAPNLLGHQLPPNTEVHMRASGAAHVDGHDGRYVVFDLIQVANGTERVRRVSLVALRPDELVNVHYRVRRWRLPMLLVIGHISPPEVHDEQHAEFAGLVSRLDLAPVSR